MLEVFENYLVFKKRKNSDVNGISEYFLLREYGGDIEKAKEDNKSNFGCWHCIDCTDMYYSTGCEGCSHGIMLDRALGLSNAIGEEFKKMVMKDIRESGFKGHIEDISLLDKNDNRRYKRWVGKKW